MAVRESILVGIGSPLLDISLTLDKDDKFLEQYGLEPNNTIFAEEKHIAMFKQIVETYENVEYIPGGATQNAIKTAQWLLGTKNLTSYMGCVGKDKFGKILEEKTQAIGVNTRYQYHEKEPTGTCAVLVNGRNRSLCAYPAAANCFTMDHIMNDKNWALIEAAQYYYIAGFFLAVSTETIMKVAKHACEKNKSFIMNLSATFLCQSFRKQQMESMPYVDILFGNETEFAAFAEKVEMHTKDLKEIALKAASLPKENKQRSRMVVITRCDKPTIIAEDGEITEFPVLPLALEDIVDTNGAGDAFVGGFLAQLVQGKGTKECVKCANYAANVIIQRSGCTFSEKPEYQS